MAQVRDIFDGEEEGKVEVDGGAGEFVAVEVEDWWLTLERSGARLLLLVFFIFIFF